MNIYARLIAGTLVGLMLASAAANATLIVSGSSATTVTGYDGQPAGVTGVLTSGYRGTLWATESGTATFTNITAIGYDTQNQLLAGLDFNETPDNLQLFDANISTADPVLVDQEFFAADNLNLNGTGAVDFDVRGGRIFALDSNNGIVALKYAGRLTLQQTSSGQVLSWPVAAAALQSSANLAGPYANLVGVSSPYTNNANGPLFFRLQR